MKSFLLKLFNKKNDIKKFHLNFFDPDRYWLISLFIFSVLMLVVIFIGALSFRYVYLEKYKDDNNDLFNINAEMRVNVLKKVVEKRENFIIYDTKIPKDPSI